MKKKNSYLIFSCLIFAICISPILFAVTHYPKPQSYVSDFANVIDPSSRQQLESQLADYERSTTNEIAVVTVPSLEGDTVENYAVQLLQAWGIGKKGKDNGILILVAPNDHKVRIEVGYGLESVLPDGLAGQIIRDDMTPYFRGDEYGKGLQAAVRSIQDVLSGNAHYISPEQTERPRLSGHAIFPILFFGALAGFPFTVLCILIAVALFARTVSFFLLVPVGFLMDIVFVHRRGGRFYNSGYYGGGFGGGGFSGGGGFGGFGGGGSGGGGASGGW